MMTRYLARSIHDTQHEHIHTHSFINLNYVTFLSLWFYAKNLKYLFKQINHNCPHCNIAMAVTMTDTFKPSQKFMGASSNIYGLLGPHGKRNHIVCLDFMGPLKMIRALFSPEEKSGKIKLPELPVKKLLPKYIYQSRSVS